MVRSGRGLMNFTCSGNTERALSPSLRISLVTWIRPSGYPSFLNSPKLKLDSSYWVPKLKISYGLAPRVAAVSRGKTCVDSNSYLETEF